jgi:hypothetical protein
VPEDRVDVEAAVTMIRAVEALVAARPESTRRRLGPARSPPATVQIPLDIGCLFSS